MAARAALNPADTAHAYPRGLEAETEAEAASMFRSVRNSNKEISAYATPLLGLTMGVWTSNQTTLELQLFNAYNTEVTTSFIQVSI